MSEVQNNCLKYCITLCISLAFMSVGLFIAMIGPTLPTLAYNLHVNIESISYVITARGFGYLVGTITSGFIYEKFNIYLSLFAALSLTAIGSVIAPLANKVELLALSLTTAGFSMGFLDTAGNVLCLQTWGDKSGPFMQTLHFCFALGTTLSPFVAMPFIMETNASESQNFSSFNASSTGVKAFNSTKHFAVVNAFVICAVFCLLIAVCFLVLACFHNNLSTSDQKNTTKEEGKVFRIKLLSLLFMFFLVYVGTEITFGVYIYTFAIRSVKHYSKSIATSLNSVFWGTFALGRFFAIPLSKRYQPSQLLKADLLGTFVAVVIFACFPYYYQNGDFLLWIAVGIYGFSMASIFPSGISWAEEYITVTGKAAMVLVVGASMGEMFLPFVVGQLIEVNSMNLLYFCLIATAFSVFIFLMMFKLATSKGKRLKINDKSSKVRLEERTVLIDSSTEDEL